MIKWAGFGKSLKRLFSIGLISCFMFLGSSSVNAGYWQLVGINSVPSNYDNQYDVTFLKGGGLLTSYLGYGKGILALKNNVLFWRTPNGYPYAYMEGSLNYQGFFDRYYSCDSFTGSAPTNCSVAEYIDYSGSNNQTIAIFKNFFAHVLPDDYVYYNFENSNYVGATLSYRIVGIEVCYSSSDIGKSLCFIGGQCGSSSSSYCNNTIGSRGDLVYSQNYSGLTFANLSLNSIGKAPGQVGYGGVYEGESSGPTQGYVDSFLTGSIVSQECTVGIAKQNAESKGLNQYVCYAGTDINNTGLQVVNPGQGSSVFDIFSVSNNGKNFSDWFLYRQGIYNNRYTYSDSVRSGYSYIYNYFNILNQYGLGLSAKDIQDYCRIIINDLPLDNKRTGNSAWCPFNPGGGPGGGVGGSWGSEGETSGDYVIGVNRGTSGQSNKDAKTFIQDFFNLAQSKIPTDFSGVQGGFLPTYIILFMCVLILFRFLSH